MAYRIHQGHVDENGNFKNRSRQSEGHLSEENKNLPFPALVVAWYPKSQTMDVIIPSDTGRVFREIGGVVVYGDFFEASGTIQCPKLATTSEEDGYATYLNPSQKDKTSDEYVLENNIEALVFKTTQGYAASSFRFMTSNSPMTNNVEPGRKIVRHDDGSYLIHDEDGNIQFRHPSGLNIRVGNSKTDIELEMPFPDHEKNVDDYDSDVTVELKIPSVEGKISVTFESGSIKIDHPGGGVFELDSTGKLGMTREGVTLKQLHDDMNSIVGAIIVAEGVGPNADNLETHGFDVAKILK